jgi:competence protein ComEA
VFVSGAVLHPGLYELPPTARVGDALTAAGGLVDGADPAVINQAERLYDGAQIHVPVPGAEPVETQPPAGLSGQPATVPTNPDTSQGRINVNTASLEELTTLPGVGPSKAAAIIANRPYETPQDLEKVPGIGSKTVAQLIDLITTQ